MTTAAAPTPEEFCRKFAQEFPTPNVLRAIEYAESGLLTWDQIATLFIQATVEVAATL